MEQFGRGMCRHRRRRHYVYGPCEILRHCIHRYASNLSNRAYEFKSSAANSGVVSSLSGGDIFYHWDFKPLRDGPVMESQLRRSLMRKMGYNCTLRVRASNG